MPVDPEIKRYLDRVTAEELREARIERAYRARTGSRALQGNIPDPHVPEWYWGPRDVSTREATSAYNYLVKTRQIPRSMSLEKAMGSPQMEVELYKRGLIAKEFAPAGRVYGGARAEILPKPGSEIAAAAKATRKFEKGLQKFESKLLPEVSQAWEQKLQRLSEAERREVVAAFKGYYKVPGRETIISPLDVEKQALMGRGAEVAAEQQAGRLSYINPLDVDRVTKKEIQPNILSKEIARQHIRTGAFVSEETLLKRKVTPREINALAAFGGEKKVYTPMGYELPGTATARYLPGTAGEEALLRRLTPRSEIMGEVPVDFREYTFGKGQQAADQLERQAISRTASRRRRVIVREKDGVASAFYSSTPRPAALRRARGREAMRLRSAMLERESKVAAPRTGLLPQYDRATRRMAQRPTLERLSPAAGRGAQQAATAITAINQSIKERAFMPDAMGGLEGLIPSRYAGRRVDLRVVDIAREIGEDVAAKYPVTEGLGIEVSYRGKRIGWVPYQRAGREGRLIRGLLGRKKVTGYLTGVGKSRGYAGEGYWAQLQLLTEKEGFGVRRARRIHLAGVSKESIGEVFPGYSKKVTQKAASRQASLEGSELFKSWMAKIPTKYKVGAAAIGIGLAALMLRPKDKAPRISETVPGEVPDASLYGGLRAGTIFPEGMEEEDFKERMIDRTERPRAPMAYSARIEDPNAIQTNIRIKGRTNRPTDFEAIGRAIGLRASDMAGAELSNVNVRVMDDSRRMSDNYIERKIARLM